MAAQAVAALAGVNQSCGQHIQHVRLNHARSQPPARPPPRRCSRIKAVRQELHDALAKINPDKDWSFVVKQIGMFTFTGMTPAQCDNMTQK